MASSQAERIAARTGRIAIGNLVVGVECQAGTTQSAVVVGMGRDSFAHAAERLDAPAAENDAPANRFHFVRGLATIVLVAAATVTGLRIRASVVEKQKETEAAGLVQALLKADTPQVPSIIQKMAGDRQWADPLLKDANQQAAAGSPEKLKTSLALLPDEAQVAYLKAQLLDAQPHDLSVIVDALRPYQGDLKGKLWAIAQQPDKGKESQRLRAAAALRSTIHTAKSGRAFKRPWPTIWWPCRPCMWVIGQAYCFPWRPVCVHNWRPFIATRTQIALTISGRSPRRFSPTTPPRILSYWPTC